ncbi:MAG: hypothetical protein N4A45_08395 [Flavobacteriales bacterium]|jgi:hypothetical protein|nr:hypothetical protein [Flavobacteriales bacterium]
MQLRSLYLKRRIDANGRECLSGEVIVREKGIDKAYPVNEVVRKDGAMGLIGINHINYTTTVLSEDFVLNLAYGSTPYPPPYLISQSSEETGNDIVSISPHAVINELKIEMNTTGLDYTVRINFDNVEVLPSMILEPAQSQVSYINPVGNVGIGDFYPYYRLINEATGSKECFITNAEFVIEKQYSFVITDSLTSNPLMNPNEGNIFVFQLKKNE